MRFDTTQFDRLQVRNEDHFLTDQRFRLVVFRDARNDLALLIAEAQLQFEQFIRFRNALASDDFCHTQLYFCEVVDADQGNAFNRFPRMIRDLAQKLAKDVDFVVSGRETELDRSVNEVIDFVEGLERSVDVVAGFTR